MSMCGMQSASEGHKDMCSRTQYSNLCCMIFTLVERLGKIE